MYIIFISLTFFFLLHFHTDNEKKMVKKYVDGIEHVGENGIKYFVYEENPVDFDNDAEVSIYILMHLNRNE